MATSTNRHSHRPTCGILEALDAAGWSQEEKEEAIRLAREGVKQIKNASSKLVPIQGGK